MTTSEIVLKKEERTNTARSKFRKLARDVCREVCDIPENNQVIFAYEKRTHKTELVGEISYQLSDLSLSQPGTSFDNEFYHNVTFMFIKEDFQLQGLGKRMLNKALLDMKHLEKDRPVRVQSAQDSVGFFEKMGFAKKGESYNTICGISLFRTMQNMELLKIH